MSFRPLISDSEKDKHKTRGQLLGELSELRAKLADKTERLASCDRVVGMLDGITEPVLVLDDESHVVYANSAAARQFAKGSEAIEGRSLWDLYPKGYGTLFYNAYEKARKGHSTGKFQENHRLLGKWFDVYLYPVPGGMTVLFNDITVSRQLEELPRLALTLLHNLKDNVFLLRADGRLFHVNNETKDSLGYSSDELHMMSIFDVVPSDCQREWRDILDRIRPHGSMTFESRLQARDGREFPVEVCANFIELYGHNYYTVSARDITERKKMGAVLNKYRLFSENARDVALFVRRDGRILEANEAAVKAYGYTREELLSLTIYDLRASDSGHDVDEQMDTAFDSGILFEALHRRKDGSMFPVEVNSQGRIIDGQKVMLSIARDITDRKRAEEALRKSEEKFRLLADFTHDWESWISPTGDYIYVSPSCERITGHGADEFYRDPGLLIKLIHPDDLAVYLQHQDSHLNSDSVRDSIDFRIVTASGETRWISHNCQPVFRNNGEWLGRRTSNRDITLRKQAEEELANAKAQAEMYVDLMGHDISNMNQIGIGYLEILLGYPGIDSYEREMMLKSLESLEGSSKLIGSVQKLQRASTEGISLKAINATDVMETVIQEFRQAPGKELTIDFRRTGDCLVSANELLKDVFVNIIGNAVKHSHPNHHLTISISADNVVGRGKKYCRFAVEDNGPGIPDATKDKLFNRFARGATKARGSGLGLYLVKTLVEHYGGCISVEDRVSEDHGQGARFVVIIPSVD